MTGFDYALEIFDDNENLKRCIKKVEAENEQLKKQLEELKSEYDRLFESLIAERQSKDDR